MYFFHKAFLLLRVPFTFSFFFFAFSVATVGGVEARGIQLVAATLPLNNSTH